MCSPVRTCLVVVDAVHLACGTDCGACGGIRQQLLTRCVWLVKFLPELLLLRPQVSCQLSRPLKLCALLEQFVNKEDRCAQANPAARPLPPPDRGPNAHNRAAEPTEEERAPPACYWS